MTSMSQISETHLWCNLFRFHSIFWLLYSNILFTKILKHQRLKEHNVIIIEYGKKLEQIKRNQQNISNHSRSLDRINKKVSKLLDINNVWMVSQQVANKNSDGNVKVKSRIQNPSLFYGFQLEYNSYDPIGFQIINNSYFLFGFQ